MKYPTSVCISKNIFPAITTCLILRLCIQRCHGNDGINVFSVGKPSYHADLNTFQMSF